MVIRFTGLLALTATDFVLSRGCAVRRSASSDADVRRWCGHVGRPIAPAGFARSHPMVRQSKTRLTHDQPAIPTPHRPASPRCPVQHVGNGPSSVSRRSLPRYPRPIRSAAANSLMDPYSPCRHDRKPALPTRIRRRSSMRWPRRSPLASGMIGEPLRSPWRARRPVQPDRAGGAGLPPHLRLPGTAFGNRQQDAAGVLRTGRADLTHAVPPPLSTNGKVQAGTMSESLKLVFLQAFPRRIRVTGFDNATAYAQVNRGGAGFQDGSAAGLPLPQRLMSITRER